MARRSVAKIHVEPVREDTKYENDAMRALSIFLGRKDIGDHLDTLTEEQREGIASYFSGARQTAMYRLQTVGKLMSGYDESTQRISMFDLGCLVQSLAEEAEAADCLTDLCEGAKLLADIRSGKVTL